MKNFNIFTKKTLVCSSVLLAFSVFGRENVGLPKRNSNQMAQKVLGGCTAPSSAAELKINNVRTIIYSGSDMWWDLFGSQDAWYCVPKVDAKANFINSTYAGNVWFGGYDESNNLKVAAQTYRQDGIDFWTGPLSTVDASIDAATCSKYDKIFKLSQAEVRDFVGADFDPSKITANIKNWPGSPSDANVDPYLAPWVDKDGLAGGDGLYTPEQGDYPYYDIYGTAGFNSLGQCNAKVYGDETLWWVYNDNGNVHQQTQSAPIGMEVRAQAFAFVTTDEINNMTFYNYQLINRSTSRLLQTYMAVWTDADLGGSKDDYIGCDVGRGLGYIYNGDSFDEKLGSANGYGDYIPSLGCDFFQGPIPPFNGVDDDHDGIMDAQDPGEQMGMTKFMYYNNVQTGPDKNPGTASEYYNLMRALWNDGSPLTYGGTGLGGSCATSYAYPDDTDTDPLRCGPQWSETAPPDDRRFIQSAGPFTLEPGAVNYVTIGLPWARTSIKGSPKSSVSLMKIADDKAQALFDNCFQLIKGPDAPDITIQELNNELILYFSNKPTSNNYLFNYSEKDPGISYDPTHYAAGNNKYQFEGFLVYQLKNENVTIEQLGDLSKAQVVFQSDINNGVTRLINYADPDGLGVNVAKVMVNGIDNGVQTTFKFTKDLFSKTPDQKVINSRSYYFMTVAYAYNQFGKYVADLPYISYGVGSLEGQKLPYLQGANIKKASAIPHDPISIMEENVAGADYGYGPKITRIEGQGNGGNNLDLTQASVDAIVASEGRVDAITYENGKGPFNIKVVDPLNVPNSTFLLRFVNATWSAFSDTMRLDPCKIKSTYHQQIATTSPLKKNTLFGKAIGDSTTWELLDYGTNKVYKPCKSIQIGQEYYFSELGLSVNFGQSSDIADLGTTANVATDRIVKEGDFIGASMEFSDPSLIWLTGVKDNDNKDFSGRNWIRSGTSFPAPTDNFSNFGDYRFDKNEFIDGESKFGKILGGTWAPYLLTASYKPTGDLQGEIQAAPAWDRHAIAASPYLEVLSGANNSYTTSPLTLKDPFYDLRGLASVNIVLTKDKSKWTRSLVLEENDNNATGARKLETRRHLSVDKQGRSLGQAGYNATEAEVDSVLGSPFLTGLGWFPGYAVNVETGERLNIAFGEDSYQDQGNSVYLNNGNDMIWNPTSKETAVGGYATTPVNNYKYEFGGRHYIYVFGNNRSSSTYTLTGPLVTPVISMQNKHVGVGNYSKFNEFAYNYKNAHKIAYNSTANAIIKYKFLHNIYTEAMWVNIPLVTKAQFEFKNPENMPCDVTVKLRVKKAYKYGNAGSAAVTVTLSAANNGYAPIVPTVVTPSYSTELTTDNATNTSSLTLNNNFGYYQFNTNDVYSITKTSDDQKSALDLINIVPNPYYGYSKYEQSRDENAVRLTNLPNKCKIKIFTLNGTLIRTFDRDVTDQFDILIKNNAESLQSKRRPVLDWDLKNQSGIAIASGLYIIHIDVPGVGEKILKWFGVMRPLDLQNY